MKTNRRRFLGSVGLGFAGILLDSKLVNANSDNIINTIIPQLGGGIRVM